MTGRPKKEEQEADSFDKIQKCLHCELDECINCLSYKSQMDNRYERELRRQRAIAAGYIMPKHGGGRPVELDQIDQKILDAYIIYEQLPDVATAVSASVGLVSYRIRRKLGLPSPKGLTKETKKELVEQCKKTW